MPGAEPRLRDLIPDMFDFGVGFGWLGGKVMSVCVCVVVND